MIDFHTHQPKRGASGELPYQIETYVEFMDSLQVDRSVVFTYDDLRSPSPAGNDRLASFVSGSAGRCVAFATVDPGSASAAGELERCVKGLGMRGLKLHPWLQGFLACGEGMDPVCEMAAELEVPILFHDGTPPNSTPLQIAALARRHPATTIVLGHGGLHDMWRDAIVAVNGCENLYLCMCSTPLYAMKRIVDQCRSDRLLFGSDAGVDGSPRPQYAALRIKQLWSLGLPESVFRAISQDNAERIIGRDVAESTSSVLRNPE